MQAVDRRKSCGGTVRIFSRAERRSDKETFEAASAVYTMPHRFGTFSAHLRFTKKFTKRRRPPVYKIAATGSVIWFALIDDMEALSPHRVRYWKCRVLGNRHRRFESPSLRLEKRSPLEATSFVFLPASSVGLRVRHAFSRFVDRFQRNEEDAPFPPAPTVASVRWSGENARSLTDLACFGR